MLYFREDVGLSEDLGTLPHLHKRAHWKARNLRSTVITAVRLLEAAAPGWFLVDDLCQQ